MPLSKYDPTLAGLLANAEADWGCPEENRQGLIHYGIPPIDEALYGLDFKAGELIGVQAPEKRRKSTLLANVVYNVAAHERFWSCIDTLESGMPPAAYRDVLLAMAATRTLIAHVFGADRRTWPEVAQIFANDKIGSLLRISKEFIWYADRSLLQASAIDAAKNALSGAMIMLFGPRPEEGEARNLSSTMDRWHRLYHGNFSSTPGKFVRLFAVDHIQQYAGWPGEDYRKLEIVTDTMAEFVTQHPGSVVILVSQVSVGSRRFAAQGMGDYQAKGGAKLSAEVNVLFQTDYDKNKAPQQMTIEVKETRRRPPPRVVQEIDPSSGAFLRPAYPDKMW